MDELMNLFEQRNVIGVKIAHYIENSNLTKAEVCKAAGISRPTLDKLLNGSLTNKGNFAKHLYKVLNGLNISIENLLRNVENLNIKVNYFRNILDCSLSDLAANTGIPKNRLQEIENGDEATLAELRDIAYCLKISINMLLGNNYFSLQISEMDLLLNKNFQAYGFWGHIGILPYNSENYLWFPITSETRKNIYMKNRDKRN